MTDREAFDADVRRAESVLARAKAYNASTETSYDKADRHIRSLESTKAALSSAWRGRGGSDIQRELLAMVGKIQLEARRISSIADARRNAHIDSSVETWLNHDKPKK